MQRKLNPAQTIILGVLFFLGAGYILGAENDPQRNMASVAIVLVFVIAIAAVLARRAGWDEPPEG